MQSLPFNRVVIDKDGARRDMTLGKFLALPLAERVSLILGRAVNFYRDEVLVDRHEALRHLRAYREP